MTPEFLYHRTVRLVRIAETPEEAYRLAMHLLVIHLRPRR